MKVLQTLTNFAQGFSQSETPSWVNFLAPEVIVGAASGQFKKFNARQDFLVSSTKRAVGGDAPRLAFGATDGNYNCMPHALEIAIDQHEIDQAGNSVFDLRAAKVRTLISSAKLSNASEVLALAKAGLSAAASPSDWGAAGDPIGNINARQKAIYIATGKMPNRVLMGFEAWFLFRENAKVIAKLGADKDRLIKPDVVGSLFLNPNTEFMIADLVKDVNLGQSTSKSELVSGDVFIFHGSNNPTQFDPGFMKTFRTSRGGVNVVTTRDEPRMEVLAIDWTEDVQVVSTISGGRLTVTG